MLSRRFGNFFCNSIWPQFHLRWACPKEAQAAEVDTKCRTTASKFSELQKAKDVSERKAKEATLKLESLTAELQRETQLNIASMNLAKKATRETNAIKRAVQSLGCNIHFSEKATRKMYIEVCTLHLGGNLAAVSMMIISRQTCQFSLQSPERIMSRANQLIGFVNHFALSALEMQAVLNSEANLLD